MARSFLTAGGFRGATPLNPKGTPNNKLGKLHFWNPTNGNDHLNVAQCSGPGRSSVSDQAGLPLEMPFGMFQLGVKDPSTGRR